MPLTIRGGTLMPPITTKGNAMTATIERTSGARKHFWRIIGWGSALALVLTPLVAMQFTREVNWDETDFIFATVIFAIVGGLIELAVRLSPNGYTRAGAAFAVFAGLLLVWSNLAVGMIGNEDNPVNLWCGGVLVIAMAGALAEIFRKGILAHAVLAAGTGQAAIGMFAGVLGTDLRGGIFTIILSGFWFISAALLCRANVRRA